MTSKNQEVIKRFTKVFISYIPESIILHKLQVISNTIEMQFQVLNGTKQVCCISPKYTFTINQWREIARAILYKLNGAFGDDLKDRLYVYEYIGVSINGYMVSHDLCSSVILEVIKKIPEA